MGSSGCTTGGRSKRTYSGDGCRTAGSRRACTPSIARNASRSISSHTSYSQRIHSDPARGARVMVSRLYRCSVGNRVQKKVAGPRFCKPGAATGVERCLGQAEFHGSGDRGLEGARTCGAELVAFNRYGGSFFVAADNASVNHQFHRTGVVQQDRPTHRKLHRHAAGQHVLRAEPDPAAGNVHGSARPGFSDPLAVEHLITDFLINLEATFDPSFPVALAVERFVVVTVVHKHRLPIDKLPCATQWLKLSLVIQRSLSPPG